MELPFVCLAAHDSEFCPWTSGYVKLLLPPRQSRGNSYFGLEPRNGQPLTRLARPLPLGPGLRGDVGPKRFEALAANLFVQREHVNSAAHC
jgi:hypothetical protein